MKGVSAAFAAALITIASSAAFACAACRNPNLPQSRASSIEAGALQLTVGMQAATTTVSVTHPAGCADPLNCDETPIQPEHSHILSMVPIELRGNVGFNFSPTLGVETELPLRLVVSRARYETPDGSPYTPLDIGVHHRDENLVGIGDVALRLRWSIARGRWWVGVRPGVTLPTGRTEENPYALGDEGLEHQHIQFGTGTVDPQIAVDVVRGIGRFDVAGYGGVQGSVYANRRGFRGPLRGFVGASAAFKFHGAALVGAAVDVSVEGAEFWDGAARSDGSLGRTELLAGPMFQTTVGATTLVGSVRVVAWRHVHEGTEDPGTLRSPVVASLGAMWALEPLGRARQ